MNSNLHYPVLLTESVELLDIKADGVYVDGTFGRGGHSKLILDKLGSNGQLICFDKDIEALEYAKSNLNDRRLRTVHDSFSTLTSYINSNDINKIDGLILDLGISSPQVDTPHRGFSFRLDALLDMRMDTTRGQTLEQWINTVDETVLANVLWQYGEERFHKRIAKHIVKSRGIRPITTTFELADIIAQSIPFHEKGQHPATRSFQALRIVINNELNDLEILLDGIPDFLNIDGRVVVISFHSLEDRLVKNKFNQLSKPKILPKWIMSDIEQVNYAIIAKKVKASYREISENIRSRSAIMRCLKRLS